MKPVRLKLILTLFIAFFGFTAASGQGTLWDKDHPLQWSNFKGRPYNDAKLDAFLSAGEYYRYTYRMENGQRVFNFETFSVMYPDSSWAKEGAHTDRMLRHVQRRFDISEFFARQMRTALNAYKYTDDFKNEAMQVATILAQERNAMLFTYEDQTNHSDDYKYQNKWDAYIADLLNSNYTLEEALAKEPKKVVY